MPVLRPSRSLVVAALIAASLLAGALAAGGPAAVAAPLPAGAQGTPVRACGAAAAGHAACLAQVMVSSAASAAGAAADDIVGLRPVDIASAYSLRGGDHGVVAIVDAFDNPNAEADLAVYREQWGLPPCTTANGCLTTVNQRGDTAPLPFADPGWGLEIALDLDAASAACPACSILLVEADDNSLDNLGIAVDTAVDLGADVVSNSYGADEFAGEQRYAARYYTHPGVPVLASSGDFGFGPASFPAVAATVIGVGGTTLSPATTPRGWSESVWRYGGSGCSTYVAKPAFQRRTGTHCRMRLTADVSAVADPATGLAVYDTFETEDLTTTGWLQVGGTSLASPLVAAMIARAGRASAYDDASGLYARAAAFHDVTTGRNGFCGGDYLCTGLPGYDAPTGVGTPAGLRGL